MKTYVLSNCAVLFLLTWAISSCGNSENPPLPSYPPVIVIYDPDEGSTVKGVIEISADIIMGDPNDIVQEVSVKVTQDSDNAIVFQETPYLVDVQNFYSYYHIITPTNLVGPTPMTLVVNAKSVGGSASKSVRFTVEP